MTLFLVGCGASGGATSTGGISGSVTLEPPAFLREAGGEESEILRTPEGSVEDLEAVRRDAHGDERRTATTRVIMAHAFAAEEADEVRAARRHRRVAERLADAAVRGTRDREWIMQVDFMRLWISWRADASNAEARAERFTSRFTTPGILTTVAWMIRGEIAFANQSWDAAREAYRFALGQLGHPLYAFALLRTANVHRESGNAAESDRALADVEQLGCDESANALVVRVSSVAATQRGTELRRDEQGVLRPASCPTEDAEEEEGWHPEE